MMMIHTLPLKTLGKPRSLLIRLSISNAPSISCFLGNDRLGLSRRARNNMYAWLCHLGCAEDRLLLFRRCASLIVGNVPAGDPLRRLRFSSDSVSWSIATSLERFMPAVGSVSRLSTDIAEGARCMGGSCWDCWSLLSLGCVSDKEGVWPLLCTGSSIVEREGMEWGYMFKLEGRKKRGQGNGVEKKRPP